MNKQITLILASLLLLVSFGNANASMVSTTSLMQNSSNISNHESLANMRTELSAELVNFGVSQQDADMRVSALTDSQIVSLNDQISSMPAGGDVVGLVVTVLIVFVITDVLGATDIYPFIHPVR